ncbi:MAG: hypothetical protein K8H99_05730 [Nitrospirae bacterium]|nr:hypothetical protein [Fimbriimonadaceae bacterium]
MLTPFDWQEGVGHRAGYVEAKLAHGAPVLAASCREGVAIFTRRKQRDKVFEIYDRLAFSAIGQQSDIEALRVAAVEYAHREGYRGSEEDVTIQRVVAAISGPVKSAFGNFGSSPFVVRSLFAEVGETPDDDRFFVLDYDGDFTEHNGSAWVGPTHEGEPFAAQPDESFESALARMRAAWDAMTTEDTEAPQGLSDEAVLLSRDPTRLARFVRSPLASSPA